MLPKSHLRKHMKGHADHVDAWLMSYADLITLLFMLFVIFVSLLLSRHEPPASPPVEQFGLLAQGTPHDEMYRHMMGLIVTNNAEQNIAVEKTAHGLSVDISTLPLFAPGAAALNADQLPLLQSIARTLKNDVHSTDMIEVEGYTDDEPVKNGEFADNWELSAMRAARIAALLIAGGVDASRLHATSYAGNSPAVPNTDSVGNPIPENRNRNQRIVIRVEIAAPAAPFAH